MKEGLLLLNNVFEKKKKVDEMRVHTNASALGLSLVCFIVSVSSFRNLAVVIMMMSNQADAFGIEAIANVIVNLAETN